MFVDAQSKKAINVAVCCLCSRREKFYWISYQSWNTISQLNLAAKIHEFPLCCISAQTGYIALAMEFTKPQIISKHFKEAWTRIPNIFRAFANSTKLIWNLVKREMDYLTDSFWSYCMERGNLKSKISEKNWHHKPWRNYYFAERQSRDYRYNLWLHVVSKSFFFLFHVHIHVTQEMTHRPPFIHRKTLNKSFAKRSRTWPACADQLV